MLRHKEPYLSFYRILGYCPHRIELYQQAVTHRSAVASDENGRKINNERLEFLGDAVFTLVTADILYHAFPEKREGFLSSSRSRIIQRETLNRIALEIGLNKLVRYPNHLAQQLHLRKRFRGPYRGHLSRLRIQTMSQIHRRAYFRPLYRLGTNYPDRYQLQIETRRMGTTPPCEYRLEARKFNFGLQ